MLRVLDLAGAWADTHTSAEARACPRAISQISAGPHHSFPCTGSAPPNSTISCKHIPGPHKGPCKLRARNKAGGTTVLSRVLQVVSCSHTFPLDHSHLLCRAPETASKLHLLEVLRFPTMGRPEPSTKITTPIASCSMSKAEQLQHQHRDSVAHPALCCFPPLNPQAKHIHFHLFLNVSDSSLWSRLTQGVMYP